MSAHPLRKILHTFGVDIARYRPSTNKMESLKLFGIKSVIDIGANVGQFAKEIRVILPDAHIYSFEPLKDCYEKLARTMSRDTHFTSFNCALGTKEGSSIINRSTYSPSSSLLTMSKVHEELFPHSKGGNTETIEIKTLDGVLSGISAAKEVLIKVDTQGYEDQVIAGGLNTFAAAKAALIETSFVKLYENQPLFDAIYEQMKSLGFIYQGALQQKTNPKTGEVVFEDSLFIKKK